jgi:hypothetical protein
MSRRLKQRDINSYYVTPLNLAKSLTLKPAENGFLKPMQSSIRKLNCIIKMHLNLDIPPKLLREGCHIFEKNSVFRKNGVELWAFEQC